MKQYVAIDMLAAKKNNLSVNEWILLENVYFLSNNEYRACYASKKTLAEYLFVSERQIYDLIKKLCEKGFLNKNNLGHLITTEKWNSLSCIHTAKIADTLQKTSTDTLQNLHTKEEISYKNIIKEKNIKKEKFKIPTLEEIKKEIEIKKYIVDSSDFFNYYQSKGWVVGKTPMKDWRAALARWKSSPPKYQDGIDPNKDDWNKLTGCDYDAANFDMSRS